MAAGGILWPAPPAAAQDGGAPAATYEVTFQGNWTLESTPGGVHSNAHFTTLIGAVHNDDVTFWRSGGRASPGVEEVAETGFTSRFRSELEASPHAATIVSRSVTFGGTGSATFPIDVTRDHPLVTLLSMIGPSPDWFVGISGRSLLDASGQWEPRVEIDLFPYDAGTEEGEEFSLSNPATVPQGVITSIRGTGKFSNERMARLTFELTATETRPTVSLSASPNPVGEGSPVTVTATLSEAPADDVTIPLTLTAGTAEADDYGPLESIMIAGGSTAGTGEVMTADDADHDDETFTVALGDLPSSVAAGTPSSVEVTISDRGPPPSVRLSASPNPVGEGSPVTVTATLSEALAVDVTIPLTLTPGTAEPDDYGALAGITVAGGSTTGAGEITTTDDADHDDETFTVTLGDLPPTVAAGTPSSVEVTITDDDPAPPGRPGQPVVTPGDGMLEVSWTPVSGAERYTVQWRSESEEYSDARQQTVETPPATLAELTNGVAYTVRVRASNAGGVSDWSEEATGTPLQPVPALPAAGAGLLGLALAFLGARRRTSGRRGSRRRGPARVNHRID